MRHMCRQTVVSAPQIARSEGNGRTAQDGRETPLNPKHTGFDAALEAIPENQLSSRQQRIAAGVAMIREGSTCLAASKAVEIPYTTLRRYSKALANVVSSEADGRDASFQALADHSIVASTIALERITERLVDDEHEWKDSDLARTYVATAEKAQSLIARPKAEDSGVSALRELMQEGDITITKRDPTKDAIDVTPEDQT